MYLIRSILVVELHPSATQLSSEPLGGVDPAAFDLGVAILRMYHHIPFTISYSDLISVIAAGHYSLCNFLRIRRLARFLHHELYQNSPC